MKPKGLSLRSTVKLGAGCVKRSPVRFFVTLFLFAVSLMMLGVCMTLGFTDQRTLERDALGAEELTLVFSEDGWSKEGLAGLSQRTGRKFQPLLSESAYHAYFFFPFGEEIKGTTRPRDGTCMNEEIVKEKGYALTGRLPQGDGEVALPLCAAKAFLSEYGGRYYDQISYPVVVTETRYIFDDRGYRNVNSLSELANGSFYLDTGARDAAAVPALIVGVVDTHCPHAHNYYSEYDDTPAPHDKLIFWEGTAHGSVNAAYALPAAGASAEALLRADEDGALQIASNALANVRENADTFSTVQNVFMWLGIAFSVFSALLIYQFISLSLERKRREIGIMRALGARKGSVLLIFMFESLALAVLSAAVACGTVPLVAMAINAYLFDEIGVAFHAGAATYLVVVALAVAVSAASSLFPVLREASRPPIDAIRKNDL